MKLDIQLFGGRGASSSGKEIVYKGSNGKKEKIKLNNTYLRDLKEIGLSQIRGKEFDSRTDMFNYLEKQLPSGASLDRRQSTIWYDSGVANQYGNSNKSYQVITYRDKETKKIGITMIGGDGYKDKDGIMRWIRYF